VAEPLILKQGATRTITITELRDANGGYLNPTGWTIHGVARAGIWGPVVATWRNTPAAGEGLAQVVAADLSIDPTANPAEKWLYLHVTPAMSDAWTWRDAVLDVEITEPGTGRVETFTVDLRLAPTTIR
jgi:hypothetical protein